VKPVFAFKANMAIPRVSQKLCDSKEGGISLYRRFFGRRWMYNAPVDKSVRIINLVIKSEQASSSIKKPKKENSFLG
jgi:hypothetical protein